jgi:hypothetical protein
MACCCSLISEHDHLLNIDMFAMAFITTCAGAELIIHELRPVLSSILAQVTCMYTNTYIIHTHIHTYIQLRVMSARVMSAFTFGAPKP